MAFVNTLGPRIRQLRWEQKLTQEQLAAKLQTSGLDMSRSTLAKVEAQVRNLDEKELYYFCAVLKVTIVDLWPQIDPGVPIHYFVTRLLTNPRKQKKKRRRSAKPVHRTNARSGEAIARGARNRAYRNATRNQY